MPDGQDRERRIGGERMALIIAAFALLFAIVLWGPWNSGHVESNPGPSGMPGSTAAHQTPPPAAGPTATTGTAR